MPTSNSVSGPEKDLHNFTKLKVSCHMMHVLIINRYSYLCRYLYSLHVHFIHFVVDNLSCTMYK